jgi:GntR family transcriptional repressor for pyruvate dehydrogenase complex
MGQTNHTKTMSSNTNVLGSVVAGELRQLIAQQRYRSGDRLPPERELASALRVSRASVREAIGRLAQEGTVVARRGSGTFVAPVNLRNVFEVRLQLEPHAAERAAMFRSTDDVAALERLVAKLEKSIDDPETFAATDTRIHATVAKASGNPVLVDVLDRLSALTHLSRTLTATRASTRRQTTRHLLRLVRAIHKRDATAASTAMRRHLQQVFETALSTPEQPAE